MRPTGVQPCFLQPIAIHKSLKVTMPELPEVEVTRLSFVEKITGAQIVTVAMGKALRWPIGCDPSQLCGQTILAVRRRGKYLLVDLSGGLLLIHLGMSGSLSFGHCLAAPGKHDHFEMFTNQGTLRLNDPRRFGAVVFASNETSDAAAKLLGRLGVEPLGDEFDAVIFHDALKKKKTSIKQVLLAGEIVVGVGNIYASETLFLAGIRPTTPACRISKARAVKLHAAIRLVLQTAVARGGSTLKNFSSANGETGHFQLEAAVYDRAGLPCRACGAPVKNIRQGQRSTFFCRTCQKP